MPIGLLRDPSCSLDGPPTKASPKADTDSRQHAPSPGHTSTALDNLQASARRQDARQPSVPYASPPSISRGFPRVSEASTTGSSEGGHVSFVDDMCSVGLLSDSRTTSIGGSSLSCAGRSFGGSSLHSFAISHVGTYLSSHGGASNVSSGGCSTGSGFPGRPRLPPHAIGAVGGAALKDSVLPRISTLGAVAEQFDACASPSSADDDQSPALSLAGAGSERGEGDSQLSPSLGLVATLRASWEPISKETGAGVGNTQDGSEGDTTFVPPALNSNRDGDSEGGAGACTPQLLDPLQQGLCSYNVTATTDDDALPQMETPGRVGAIVALFDDAIQRSVGTGRSLHTSSNAAAQVTPPSIKQEQSPVPAGSGSRIARPPRLIIGNGSGGGGPRSCGSGITASTTPPPMPLSLGRATGVGADATTRRLTASHPALECAGGGVAGGARGAHVASRAGLSSRAANALPVSTSSRPHTRSAGAYPSSVAQQPPKRGNGGVPRTSALALSQAPVRPPFNLYGKPSAARAAPVSTPGDSRGSVSSPADSQAASPSVSSAGTECAGIAPAGRRQGTRLTRAAVAQAPLTGAASGAAPAASQQPVGRRLPTAPAPHTSTAVSTTSSRPNITAITTTTVAATASAGAQRSSANNRNSRLLRAPGNPVTASTPLSPSGKKVANTVPSAVARAAAAAVAGTMPPGNNLRGLLRRPVCRYSVDSGCSDGMPSGRQLLAAAAATSPTEAVDVSSPLRRPEQCLRAWRPCMPASPLPAVHSPADTLPLLRSPCCPSPRQFSPGQPLPPPPLSGSIMEDLVPMASPILAATYGGAAAEGDGPASRPPSFAAASRPRRRRPSDSGWPWPLPESPRLSDAEELQPRGGTRSGKRRAARAAAAAGARSSGRGSDAGSDGGDDFGLPAWAWSSVATLLSQSVEASGLRQSSQLTPPEPPSQPKEAADKLPQLPGYAQHDPSLVSLRRLSGTPNRRRSPNVALASTAAADGGQQPPSRGAGFRVASGELVSRPRYHRRPTSPGEANDEGAALLLCRQAAPRGRYGSGSTARADGAADGCGAVPLSQHSSDSEEPSEPLPLPPPDDDEAVGCWQEEDDDSAATEPPAACARLLPSLSGSCIDAMVFASLRLSGTGPPPQSMELPAAAAPDGTDVIVEAAHSGDQALAVAAEAFAATQPTLAANCMTATPTEDFVDGPAQPFEPLPLLLRTDADFDDQEAAVSTGRGDGDSCGGGSCSSGGLSETSQVHVQQRRRPSVELLNGKLARVIEGLRAVARIPCCDEADPMDQMSPSAAMAPVWQPAPAASVTSATAAAADAEAPADEQLPALPSSLRAGAGARAAAGSPEAGRGRRVTALELSAIVTVLGAADALLSSGATPAPYDYHAWRRGSSSAGGAPPQAACVPNPPAAGPAASPATAWGEVWTAALCAVGVMAAAALVASTSSPLAPISVFTVAGMAAAVLLAAKASGRRSQCRSSSQRGTLAPRLSVSGLGSTSGLGLSSAAAAAAAFLAPAVAAQLRTCFSRDAASDAAARDAAVIPEPIPDTARAKRTTSSEGNICDADGEGAGTHAAGEECAGGPAGGGLALAAEAVQDAGTAAGKSSRAHMLGIASKAAETCREAIFSMRAAGADRATMRRLARACGAFAGMQMAAAVGGGARAAPPDIDPVDWSLVQAKVRQRLARSQQSEAPAIAVGAAASTPPSFQSPLSGSGAASAASPVPAAAAAPHWLAPPAPGVSPIAWHCPRADVASTSPQATVRRELLALVSKAAGADDASVARGSAAIAAAVAELARSRAAGRPDSDREEQTPAAEAAGSSVTERRRREYELAAAEAEAVALVAARKSIGEHDALETFATGAHSLLTGHSGRGGGGSSSGPPTARGSSALLSESSALEVLAQECRTRHTAYAHAAATCSSISALAAVAETAALEALAARREEALAAHAAALAFDARLCVRAAVAADTALLQLLKERSDLATACFAVEAADAAATLRASMAEADSLAVLATGREQELCGVAAAAAADAALAVRGGAASARAVLELWSRRQQLLGHVACETAAGAVAAVRAADGEEAAVEAYVAVRRQVLSLVSAAVGGHAADTVRGSLAFTASIQDMELARLQQLRAVSEAAAFDSALAITAEDREEEACRACAEGQVSHALACAAVEAASISATMVAGILAEDAALFRLAKARVVLAGVCFAVEAMDAATSLRACSGEEAAVKALARRRLRCRAAYAGAAAAAAAKAVAGVVGEDIALEQLVARRQANLSEYALAMAEGARASTVAADAEDVAQQDLAMARSAELASHAVDMAISAAATLQAQAGEEEETSWGLTATPWRRSGRAVFVDAAVGTSGEDLDCVDMAAAGQAVQVCALALLEMQKKRLSLYATVLGTSLGALVAAATAGGRCGQGWAGPGFAAMEAAAVVTWPYLAPVVRCFPLRSFGGASVESAEDSVAECGGQLPAAPMSFPLVMQGEAAEQNGNVGGGGGEKGGRGGRQQRDSRGRPWQGKGAARAAVVVRSFGLRRLQAATSS